MDPRSAYAELIHRCREDAYLTSAYGLLGWDEETYMPRAAAEYRGEQLAYLAGLIHTRGTDPRVGELLHAVEGSEVVADPESIEAVNVRLLRLAFDRDRQVPTPLVEEEARITPTAQQAWSDARRASDYRIFRPWLAKILALKREEADAHGYECRYDGLLEVYDPGLRTADLNRMFAALRSELVPLAAQLATAPGRPSADVLARRYPVEQQRVFCERIAAAVGFDFQRGRLDMSTHPFFATTGPADVRVTARFHETNFGDGFFSTLHEVGHGLYEQGLDSLRYGEPVAESPSSALHESQARLWENFVGRGRGFWNYAFPIARRLFPDALNGVNVDAFYAAFNRVAPSINRVQADEVTYNLHILIRFELEQALLSGDLPVDDLPGAWAEKYQTDLGVIPDTDADGCLQDSHWSAGMFGYFPAYAVGTLYAAQLYHAAETATGGFGEAFAAGDFTALLGWLRGNIHTVGGRYEAPQLIRQVTGAAPDHRPFLTLMRAKYLPLYGL